MRASPGDPAILFCQKPALGMSPCCKQGGRQSAKLLEGSAGLSPGLGGRGQESPEKWACWAGQWGDGMKEGLWCVLGP